MRGVATLILFLLAWAATGQSRQGALPANGRPLVILVSFDGWRWDYDSKAPTPNLRRLMARGVRAAHLVPSFPSKTFPNHYTIVTGLHPGHHGIIANNIKDQLTGRTFAPAKQAEVRDPMWWGGEPIWVTAERASHLTAAMFWVGSEAPIKGILPRYWKAYDESVPGNARVDQVLAWLDLRVEDRPTFISLYFEDPDTAGHNYGPDSRQVREAIMRADAYLGRLLRGLERRRLLDVANIVVVSDHGMAAVNDDRVVILDDYISLADVEIVDINPLLSLFPKPGKEEAVYQALAGAHPRLKVYRPATMPEHWQYRDSPRVPPIFGMADEGWQVVRRNTIVETIARRIRPARGQHGYDPVTAESMRGLFVAAGPAFKRNTTVPAFQNIHIYNALASALGVTPAPNDGDPAVARSLLR